MLGLTTLFAGSGTSAATDGTGTSASFVNPSNGITVDIGGVVYVAEFFGHRIRKITGIIIFITVTFIFR